MPRTIRKHKWNARTKKLRGSGLFDFGNNQPNQKKTMNYPNVSISYNNKVISCETCGTLVFYKIDISVNRSKTASLGADILFGSDNGLDHPLRMYTCIECNTCKTVYAPTMWNGLTASVIEIPPQVSAAPQQQVDAP